MADVPVYSVVSQRKYKTSVLKPKCAWSWQGNTEANEIARALSGCRSAIGQIGFKICAPIRRSQHVVTISVILFDIFQGLKNTAFVFTFFKG